MSSRLTAGMVAFANMVALFYILHNI